MNQLDPSWDAEQKEALIRQGKVGSIFNVVGAKQINRLQRMAVEETRLGIPLVVARDVIHGYRTIYPIPLGQGATWNPELVEQAAQLTAKEAVSDGIRWAFSPMVDVAHDPRWGRVAEGYGEDPLLTSQMAAATVRGYQHELSSTPQDGPSKIYNRPSAVKSKIRRQPPNLSSMPQASGPSSNSASGPSSNSASGPIPSDRALGQRTSNSAAVQQSAGRSAGLRPALAACVKHFAGYSASEGGRDYNTTWIPETQLRDIYLPPFKAALDAGAMSVMCSFNALNGLPSSANHHLNVDILRDEWHSDALLVSDWGSGSDLVPHGLCADKKEAAERCINARMEMDMQGNIYTDYLAELIAEGKVKESQIDDCVRSILRLKYRLGLFDNPYVDEDKVIAYTPEALELATRVAEESAILLKNNGILPLSISPQEKSSSTIYNLKSTIYNKAAPPNLSSMPQASGPTSNSASDLTSNSAAVQLPTAKRSILITGPLAHQKKEQLGTWVFDAQPDHSVTPLEAFQQMVSSFDFPLSTFDYIYEPGLAYSRDKNTDFSKVIAKAKQADVILYFCGEEAILSGEARCRADLNLPGAQRELMKALATTGKPVVMIVMAGRPLTIGAEVEQAAAVLYAFHGGTMAGQALCNIITGKTVPSGKTPITFPKMVGQVPLYYNRLNTGRPSYDPPMLIDSIPIGCPQFSIGQSSYWLETPTEPLFPFGFGLSYTTFEYGPTHVQMVNDKMVNGFMPQAESSSIIYHLSSMPQASGLTSNSVSGQYTVSCTIKNTGSYDAYETAQLYAHQLSGAVARPIAELKGFKKVFIPAGDSCTVTFTITPEQLGYWHESWEPVRGSDVKAHRYYFATDNAPFSFRIAPHS